MCFSPQHTVPTTLQVSSYLPAACLNSLDTREQVEDQYLSSLVLLQPQLELPQGVPDPEPSDHLLVDEVQLYLLGCQHRQNPNCRDS